MGFLSAALGGMSSFLGSSLGGVVGSVGGSLLQNAQNNASAKAARNWQEKMYDTRYQRTVADLEKAGLNPLLAVGGLAGTAGSGASATTSQADIAGSSAKAIQASLALSQKNLADSEASVSAQKARQEKITADKMQQEYDEWFKNRKFGLGTKDMPSWIKWLFRSGDVLKSTSGKSTNEIGQKVVDKFLDVANRLTKQGYKLKSKPDKSKKEVSFKEIAELAAKHAREFNHPDFEKIHKQTVKNQGKYKYIKTKDGGIRMERK